MMFSVVLFGSCLACCLAESFNYAPYSATATGSSSAYAGSAPYSGEWAASSGSNGFKMSMGAPKSGRQFQFQPNTFYSQLNYQPPSETVPSYRASGGYSKSVPFYSFGNGYSGHQSSIGEVSQTASPNLRWFQISLESERPTFPSGNGAYSSGVYSGQSGIAQVAQPAFAPAAKVYSGPEAGYPTVTAEGYLKDTPEVLEAKKAHFAEKMRIAKYMGNDESQYAYMSSAPQYDSAPASGNSFASSTYYPTAGGVSSNPVAYSHTVGRQKREISDCLEGPTFHALPAHPTFHALPPPTFHALPAPTFHALPAPTFHALPAPTFHALPAPTFHALPAHPTFHALPALPTFHALPHPETMTLAHSLPTFHHTTLAEATPCLD